MTIQIKFESTPRGKAQEALDDHASPWYHRSGAHHLIVAEVKQVDRNDPATGEKGSRWVKMAVVHAEVPNSDEQQNQIRAVLRALHLQRTAQGKLTEDGDVELSEQTLKHAAGMLQGMEVARLRAGLGQARDYARRVTTTKDMTHSEVLHELEAVVDMLDRTLKAARDDEDGQIPLDDAED